MKSKALIIGALPEPFEGPWIPIQEADSWKLVPGEGQEAIVIEVCDGLSQGEPKGLREVDEDTPFSGQFARAVVTKEVPDLSSLSVEIEVAI